MTYRRTEKGFELSSTCGGSPSAALSVTHAPLWRWTDIDEHRVKDRDSTGLVDQSNGGLSFNHDNFYFCDMPARRV